MIKNYIKFALDNLKYRKVRTLLTVLGIIIGIAAIVSLVSVSEGLQDSITEQFEKMGADRIYVMGGQLSFSSMSGSSDFTKKDVETIEKVKDVEWTNPYLMGTAKIKYGREEEFSMAIGLETEGLEEKWEDMNLEAREGRLFKGGEKYAIVLGPLFAEDFFKKEVRLNSKLEIEEKDFRVIGIMEAVGNSQDDNQIYLPMETAREIFDKPHEVTAVEVKAKTGTDLDEVAKKIRLELERARNDENFEVITPEQLMRQVTSTLMIIQVVLVGIATISLIVGAIGILNSMYTSVLERTKEIGIMKSIGATNKNILFMFMAEAGIQGIFGGITGSVLGILLSKAIGKFAENAGFGLLKVPWNIPLMLMGTIFAFLVAISSGYLPAKQASKLSPREALSK